MDLRETAQHIDQGKHWYYQSKKIPLHQYFSALSKNGIQNIIDIGAGTGFFSKDLFQYFPNQIHQIQCVDTGYDEPYCIEHSNSSIKYTNTLNESFDHSLVVLMDVLEHIEDEDAFLKSILSKENGHNFFFLTVPAFQVLWSGHDDYLLHYRRYTIASLKKVLIRNGFKIDRMYYMYGSLFPLVWLRRKLFAQNKNVQHSDLKPLPNWLNFLLLKYASFENRFARFNRLFGITCVAEGKLSII